jgi:hypothetical protein
VPSLAGGQVGGTAYVATTGSIKLLDRRLRLDDDLRAIRAGPEDPYTARRALYLRKRQAEIDGLHSKRWRTANQRRIDGRTTEAAGQGTDLPVVTPVEPDREIAPALRDHIAEPVPAPDPKSTDSAGGF